MKKQLITVWALLASILALNGCGTGSQADPGEKLYTEGLSLIAQMDAMAESGAFRALMSGSRELDQLIRQIGEGDYTAPKEVYKLAVPEGSAVMPLMQLDGDLSSLSEELQPVVEKKVVRALGSLLNGSAGVEMIAASASVAADSAFLCKGAPENAVYFYLYDGAYSALVCFTPMEEGTVAAYSSFAQTEALSGFITQPMEGLAFEKIK